jgi:uncharacterized protein (TIGR02996 family)
MTDEEKALTGAFGPDPAGDVARLAYADWLDERGRHAAAALQRVLANPTDSSLRLAYAQTPDADPVRRQLVEILAELNSYELPSHTASYPPDYLSDMPARLELYGSVLRHLQLRAKLPFRARFQVEVARSTAVGCCGRHADNQRCFCLIDSVQILDWYLGFVSAVQCRPSVWCDVAAGVRAAEPVTRVTFTEVPPVAFDPMNRCYFWWDSGLAPVSQLRIADRIGGRATPEKLVVAFCEEVWPGIRFHLLRPLPAIFVRTDTGAVVTMDAGPENPQVGDWVYADHDGYAHVATPSPGTPHWGIGVVVESPQ